MSQHYPPAVSFPSLLRWRHRLKPSQQFFRRNRQWCLLSPVLCDLHGGVHTSDSLATVFCCENGMKWMFTSIFPGNHKKKTEPHHLRDIITPRLRKTQNSTSLELRTDRCGGSEAKPLRPSTAFAVGVTATRGPKPGANRVVLSGRSSC